MSNNNFRQFQKGIIIRPICAGPDAQVADPTDNLEGSFWVSNVCIPCCQVRLKSYLDSGVRVVVTENQTQTLSNKTLTSPTINCATITIVCLSSDDDEFTLRDADDITKTIQFRIDPCQTTCTQILLSVPPGTDTLAGIAATQTFTNKSATGLTITDFTDYCPSAAPAHTEGRFYYDNCFKSLVYFNDEACTEVHIGQENVIRVRNTSGCTITDGSVVYINGAISNLPTIAMADADCVVTSQVIGIMTHDIENNTNGYATTFGTVHCLNTSAFCDGDSVYLSSTAGALTATKPAFPAVAVRVGIVTRAHASLGTVFVEPVTEEGSNFQTGSVFFSKCNRPFEDNTGLFFDDTCNRLGINTTCPVATLDVNGDTQQSGSIIFDEQATPANPSACDLKLYAKTDCLLYQLDSAGNERALVSDDSTQTLTNKTIGDTNTINAQDDAFTIDDAADATLQIDFNAAGTTCTKTTITSSQTTNKVVTLPDATDTLVGKATTDTLTNKTIGNCNTINAQDDAFTIQDAADATLEIDFNAVGTTCTKTTITSSQTANRVWTLPDATDTAVGKATTDTLTSKTITDPQICASLVFCELACTPANPSACDLKLYAKCCGSLFTLNSSGAETKVGAGAGGELNFYTLGCAECATVCDFVTGNNATFDGGGCLVGTFSVSTTCADLIRGTKVFKYIQDGCGSEVNDYISTDPICIPRGYRGRTLALKLQYKYDGANCDIKWVVKDTTSGSLLTTGVELFQVYDNADGTAKEFSIQVPIPTDTTQIEIGPQVVSNTATAVLIWDDVIVNDNAFVGACLGQDTDWADYTPTITGFGTAASVDFQWRRDGPDILIRGIFTTGTPTATEAQITLPSCITSSSSIGTLEMSGIGGDGTNSAVAITTTMEASKTYFTMGRVDNGGSLQKLNGSAIAGSTVILGTTARIPINGWTTTNDNIIAYSSKFREDSMVRVYDGNGHGSTNTKIRRFVTTDTNTGCAITFACTAADGASFTINETGVYYISYNDIFGAASCISISKNECCLTTDANSLPSSDVLNIASLATTNEFKAISWSGTLLKDEVIRPHTTGAATSPCNFDGKSNFTITKLGQQSLVGQKVPLTAYIKDVKSSGTAGGTFTLGAWRTRNLNTLSGQTSFISLSCCQFTLQPGTYNINAFAPAYKVFLHKIKLRNITDCTDDIIGSSINAESAPCVANTVFLEDEIILTTETIFEIQHRSSGTVTTSGFGVAASFCVDEIYTQVTVIKID